MQLLAVLDKELLNKDKFRNVAELNQQL